MLDSAFEPQHAVPSTLEQLATGLSQRSAAVTADQRSEGELALSELWLRLAGGGLEILDSFTTKQRCYLVVRQRDAVTPTAAQARGMALLKRVYVAGCQKVAAFDLGMSPSSATEVGKNALLALGLRCRIQDSPFMLVAAANAEPSEGPLARCNALHQDEPAILVLSIARPDGPLARLLTPAVLEVTSAMVEGQTRSHIARLRARSQRTVANQLASAFRQLNAFSRLDLLRVLATAGSRVAKGGGIELKAPAPAPDLNARLRHVSSYGAHVAAMLP